MTPRLVLSELHTNVCFMYLWRSYVQTDGKKLVSKFVNITPGAVFEIGCLQNRSSTKPTWAKLVFKMTVFKMNF
jgi:hypothetical protein